MFKDNQIVTADNLYEANWQIDCRNDFLGITYYISPDNTQCAAVYDGKENEVLIERYE